jgi:hypothetical protein
MPFFLGVAKVSLRVVKRTKLSIDLFSRHWPLTEIAAVAFSVEPLYA